MGNVGQILKRWGRVLRLGRTMAARTQLTYGSFASNSRNLGVLILEGALTPHEFIAEAHRRLLHPGGSLMVFIMDARQTDAEYRRMFENRGRLLTPDEARVLLNTQLLHEWARQTNG